jgi:hypothetical protein
MRIGLTRSFGVKLKLCFLKDEINERASFCGCRIRAWRVLTAVDDGGSGERIG